MRKASAVEILVFKPNSAVSIDKRGVHENLWIKQRFNQYLSIGVYLEGEELKYYFWEKCDEPTRYSSLSELKKYLPKALKNIFDQSPELFLMGHGRGDGYGLGNHPVEIIGAHFDKIITDFEGTLSPEHDEIFVTLEACNTDNAEQAARGGFDKTFLERVSETHRHMTFSGTTPWDPNDPQTGYRASGGFPKLNAPFTAMNGGVWKLGNSVAFYHNTDQVVVKKTPFATTQTTKELKANTLAYASDVLKKIPLHDDLILDAVAKKELIKKIAANRDILKIDDLKKVDDFPKKEFEDHKLSLLAIHENCILEKEKNNYIALVKNILTGARSGEKFSDRDLLNIALGLKNISVFNGHEALRDEILSDKRLLKLIMVTCGKALIADQSNDKLIDFLLGKGIDVNSVDENGMTALHHAVQNFYFYRREPLNLISKLLSCGANLEQQAFDGRAPVQVAREHCKKDNVGAKDSLLELLEQRVFSAHAVRLLLSPNLSFFGKSKEYLAKHRHDSSKSQHEYDQKFGLVLRQ